MKRIIILPLLIISTLFMSICCSGPSSRIAPEKTALQMLMGSSESQE